MPDSLDKARALNQLGRVERLSGNLDLAFGYLRRSSELLDKSNPTERAWAKREMALCHRDLGDNEHAERLLHQSIQDYRFALNAHEVATTFMILGDLLREKAGSDASAEAYRQGLEAIQPSDQSSG